MKSNKEFKTTSYLSESCELNGRLYTRGGIRIDGKLKGTLSCDSTIFVGDTAEIEAEIVTGSLVSGGKITGNIAAEDTVQINRPGSVKGEIRACRLGIEREVMFDGKCQLISPKQNNRPEIPRPKAPRKALQGRD